MISDELYKKRNSMYGLPFFSRAIKEYRFTRLFLETVTSVFKELIQSNVFGFEPDEVTYFITMSDDNRTKKIENNSAKALNSKKVYKEFLKRYKCV